MSFEYHCAACAKLFTTEKDAKATFEEITGQPFDARKVAIVCDDCTSTAGYTCDMCGNRFMSSPTWSDAHAAKEFEIMFGRPFDPDKSAALCDSCYHMAMAEIFPDGLAWH